MEWLVIGMDRRIRLVARAATRESNWNGLHRVLDPRRRERKGSHTSREHWLQPSENGGLRNRSDDYVGPQYEVSRNRCVAEVEPDRLESSQRGQPDVTVTSFATVWESRHCPERSEPCRESEMIV